MNRPKPEGRKGGTAPGTQLPQPKKPPEQKPEPQQKPLPITKHPMGPKLGDGPSVWQSLSDIIHGDDHR